ncbi:hypothetical protein THAOC_25262, partial [Thalassiosira oceanica]
PFCAACGGPSAVHAAILDEAAGRAVLELDGVALALAAVGAGFVAIFLNRHAAAHAGGGRPLGEGLEKDACDFRKKEAVRPVLAELDNVPAKNDAGGPARASYHRLTRNGVE